MACRLWQELEPDLYGSAEALCPVERGVDEGSQGEQVRCAVYSAALWNQSEPRCRARGSWIAMQPSAVLVLHSGWAKHVDLEREFLSKEVNSTDSSQSVAMLHSVSYMNELARLIKERDPRRIVRQTRVIDALHEIQLDIKRGAAPLKSVRELYRDDIHLTFTGGRYLAHNMLRQTLGLSPSSQGFQLDEELHSYLDKIISRFCRGTLNMLIAPPLRNSQGKLPLADFKKRSNEELATIITQAKRQLGSRLLILGHHYQQDEVIAHADLTGDSYQLSQLAAASRDCGSSCSAVSTSWLRRLTFWPIVLRNWPSGMEPTQRSSCPTWPRVVPWRTWLRFGKWMMRGNNWGSDRYQSRDPRDLHQLRGFVEGVLWS